MFLSFICLFMCLGSVYSKSLQEINNDLQYIVKEMKSNNIIIDEEFEEAVHQFDNIVSNIPTLKQARGSDETTSRGSTSRELISFNTLKRLIKIFIDKYQSVYNSFQEFLDKWKNGEISEDVDSPVTSESIEKPESSENTKTPEASESLEKPESSKPSTESESLEKPESTEESTEESKEPGSSENTETSESFEESESAEESKESEPDVPEWLSQLMKTYEGIIDDFKEVYYPSLIFFDEFSSGVADKIKQSIKYFVLDLFRERLQFEQSKYGLEFLNRNNTYFKYFIEQGHNESEILKHVDEDLVCRNISMFNESKYYTLLTNSCEYIRECVNVFEFKIKSEDNTLEDQFNKITEKFNKLDSCYEESEEEEEPQPNRPHNRNNAWITSLLLSSFLLLVF